MRTRWLLLVLLSTTPAFSAPKFPFLEAMKRLDSTEKKLEHLRGWHFGLAKENGISRRDGRRFEGLLKFYVLYHANDDGELDCMALDSNLARTMPRRMIMNRSTFKARAYVMFNITVDELCPEIATFGWNTAFILEHSWTNPLEALSIMDGIVELYENHDLQLPVDFLFRYGEVAYSAKSYEDALEAVRKYLAAADSGHEDYGEALKLREAIQEKLRKGQR